MAASLDYGIPAPNYRLPSATHVGRVKLQVSDLARSLSFYENVLGLRAIDQRSGHAVLAPHGDDTPLIDLAERRGARRVPSRGLLGLYHFAILLPDRASLGRLLAHLAELGESAGMSDHLVSEAIYLHDPDNLGIEVYADRPRSSWRHEDGQLTMATLPLDARTVIAAAGEQRWSGVPAGTRIGHLHLHVGDLTQAEAFYHRALGLDKMVWSYPGALFLSAGGYHHHLGTNTWAGGASSASDEDAKLLEWELVVPEKLDVDAAGRSLERAGTHIRHEDGQVIFRDPWDTQLRVKSQTG